MKTQDKCIKELEKLDRRGVRPKRIEQTLAKIRPRIVANEKTRPLLKDVEERVRAEDIKGAIKILRGPYYLLKWILFVTACLVVPLGVAVLGLSTIMTKCDPFVEADKTAVAFASDLSSSKLKQAYERMTPNYRKHVRLASFRKQVQSTPLLATVKKFKPTGGSTGGTEYEIYGAWTTAAGTKKAVVTVHKLDGKHYIQDVEIDKKSLLPQPTQAQPPEEKKE